MIRRGLMGACALGLGFGLGAGQAGAQSVTLAEALRQAMRSDNPTLRELDDNVAEAAGRVQEARGAFDWNTSVQGGIQQLYVPTALNGYLTNHTGTVNSYYYQANVGRQFRNGLVLAPGVTAFPGSGATPAQTAGLTQLRPALGLKIPLLRGAGSGGVDAGERGALDNLRGARENRAFAAAQFAQNVAITFWRCVADDQILKQTQDADAHASAYGANLAKLQHKGILEPTIVQQWAATNAAQHLNVARAQEEAKRCHRDLAYVMTGGVNRPWAEPAGDLPPIDPIAPALERLNESDLVALAIDRREDLKALTEAARAAHENLRGAKDGLRPALDLHVDPEHAFVSYTQSFGNNLAKGREAEAVSAEDKANLALRQAQDQVRDQVSDALSNLRRAASDWATLDQAANQMETVVSDAEKRARFGVIVWSDYLAAQNQLTQLRQQTINARLAFADGLATLRFVTGTIDPNRTADLAVDLVALPKP